MRFSSTFIELPTPPFGTSNTPMTSDLPRQTAMPLQKSGLQTAGLDHITTKPIEALPTFVPQNQFTQHPQATDSRTSVAEPHGSPSVLLAPSRENGLGPAGLVYAAPKSAEVPPVSGAQVQTPSESQRPYSIAPTTVRPEKPNNSPIPPNNTVSGYIESSLASQNPFEAPSTSVPQVQSYPQNPAPAPQTLSARVSTAEPQNITKGTPTPREVNSNLPDLLPIAPLSVNGQPPSLHVEPQLQVTTPTAQIATSAIPGKQQKAPIAPRQRKSITKGKRGRKRRRGHDSDNEVIRAGDSSSDESDIAPTATQTKSGRHINRPSLYVPPAVSPPTIKGTANSPSLTSNMAAPVAPARKRQRAIRKRKDINVNCVHCQRGHSPLNNTIVFCDECNKAWHQLCHDPPIDNEVVTVQEKEWLCRGCKPAPLKLVFPSIAKSNATLQSRPLGPPVHPPLPTAQIEVGGGEYSRDERRGYLSSLSHATLVDLLVTISERNPSVPLFPTNLKSLPASKFSYQSSSPIVLPPSNSAGTPATSRATTQATNTPSTEQEANQNSLNPTPNPLPVPSAQRGRYEESSDESEYEEVEDHRLYPRPGNGFRLSLNANDLDIMQEDPACPTFSYALHGPAKTRAEANEAAPVWGAA